jgi:DNA-binding response OmpR family regulator
MPIPLKVLVAEDEPAMLSLLARHMKNLGFSVIEASEGDVAWELAQENIPDLVILDVMMPGMSGWEICKRLKSQPPGSPFEGTGVIMLTGIGENLNEMTSSLFAADAWLNKPFEFPDLDAKIRETLEQYGKASPTPPSKLNGSASRTVQPAHPKPVAKSPRAKAASKKAAPKKKPVAAKKASPKKAAPKKAVAKKAMAKSGNGKKAIAKPANGKKAMGKSGNGKKAIAKPANGKKGNGKKTPAAKSMPAKRPAARSKSASLRGSK